MKMALQFLMVSLTSLEVPHEGCVSGGSLPSSWWGVFHSFPLWTYDDVLIQDHAHASSRNRFSIRTAYTTVLQHERKPATTGSFVMFLNSLWNPPTCTMPQGEKIAALCLMLECVSILAGILVVSGPSKLEFGDVWGKDICKSCVKVWIIMRVCIYSLCMFMFSVLYVSFLIYNRCLFYKLLKWDFGTMAVGPDRLRRNSQSMFHLDGQLSLYDIIWHLVTLWMVHRWLSRAKAPDTVYMCTQMNGESMRRFKRARR